MEKKVKVTISGNVYKFYQEAARNVADSSPESIMSDALGCYARFLSPQLAKEWEDAQPELNTDTK